MSQGLKDAIRARDTILDAGKKIEDLIPHVTELWHTIGSGLEAMYDGHAKAQQSMGGVLEAMRKKGEDDRREKERLRKELEEARKAGEEASRKLRRMREDRDDAQKRLRAREEELRRKAPFCIPLFLFSVREL